MKDPTESAPHGPNPNSRIYHRSVLSDTTNPNSRIYHRSVLSDTTNPNPNTV